MKYLTVKYTIAFDSPVVWGSAPSFVFRSVLGMNLKRTSCILRNQEGCETCCLNATCVYSCFFETHIDKETDYLQGRNRAPHPFVIDFIPIDERRCELDLVFIGKGVNYLPYVTLAFQRGENRGVGKSRTPYKVLSVTSDGAEIDYSPQRIEAFTKEWPSKDFELPDSFSVRFVTPCRIKEGGVYQGTITLEQFVKAIYRRMYMLNECFGLGDKLFELDEVKTPIATAREQKWSEKTYYSSRQQDKMRLGGVVGYLDFSEKGNFEFESLLEAATIFHVGKNISFGLGKVEITKG